MCQLSVGYALVHTYSGWTSRPSVERSWHCRSLIVVGILSLFQSMISVAAVQGLLSACIALFQLSVGLKKMCSSAGAAESLELETRRWFGGANIVISKSRVTNAGGSWSS